LTLSIIVDELVSNSAFVTLYWTGVLQAIEYCIQFSAFAYVLTEVVALVDGHAQTDSFCGGIDFAVAPPAVAIAAAFAHALRIPLSHFQHSCRAFALLPSVQSYSGHIQRIACGNRNAGPRSEHVASRTRVTNYVLYRIQPLEFTVVDCVQLYTRNQVGPLG